MRLPALTPEETNTIDFNIGEEVRHIEYATGRSTTGQSPARPIWTLRVQFTPFYQPGSMRRITQRSSEVGVMQHWYGFGK